MMYFYCKLERKKGKKHLEKIYSPNGNKMDAYCYLSKSSFSSVEKRDCYLRMRVFFYREKNHLYVFTVL